MRLLKSKTYSRTARPEPEVSLLGLGAARGSAARNRHSLGAAFILYHFELPHDVASACGDEKSSLRKSNKNNTSIRPNEPSPYECPVPKHPPCQIRKIDLRLRSSFTGALLTQSANFVHQLPESSMRVIPGKYVSLRLRDANNIVHAI